MADPTTDPDATLPPPDVSFSQAPTLAPTERLGPASSPPIGPTIPGYELLGTLGKGGMGVVYRARQVGLNRPVALKMILGGQADAAERLRFRAEAEAIARLQHPNIVQVYEIGEYDGQPFFSLELCTGGSLASRLDGTPWTAAAAASLVEKLARAMEVAHGAGIVHRDLKPANVLLGIADWRLQIADLPESERGRAPGQSAIANLQSAIPKIADFGLAKVLGSDSGQTRSGSILGTPSYMAPEQASGQSAEVGPTADVWALGAILYELLTGRPPFKAANALDTLLQVRELEPVPPSRLQPGVPADLETICLKCLQKASERRYASARALAEDLRRFQDGEAILARPVGHAERCLRWCWRNPAVASLLALVVVCVAAGVGGVVHFAVAAHALAHEAMEARDAAEEAHRHEREAHEEVRQGAERLRTGLVRQHVATGTHFLDAGEYGRGLWWFCRAWQLDKDTTSAEPSHRLRLGLTLAGGTRLVGACFHRQLVLDAQFDPAGKTVLTLTGEVHVTLWDAEKSQEIAVLKHGTAAQCAAFQPGGGLLGIGTAGGDLCLWDTATGTLRRTLPQGAPVLAVAFRPDGARVAVANEAGRVRFWDLETGKEAAPGLDCSAAVYHVAYRPDGARIVTADAGGMARVWNETDGRPVGRPLPHRDHRAENEYAISYRLWPEYSRDGRSLVTVQPKESATVWDPETGQERYPALKHAYELHQVHFSPDSSRLVAHAGDTVVLYDAATGKRLLALRHPRESQHSCFRPDGKALATCSTGGLVHRWDLNTGEELAEPLRTADGIQSLAYAPDGSRLLAASYDGVARVWRTTAPRAIRPHTADCGRAELAQVARDGGRVTFSPDGSRELRYGGVSGGVLAERGGGKDVALAEPLPLLYGRFTPDGRRVLTQNRDFVLRWWNAATGQETAPAVQLAAALHALAISADGGRLLTQESAPPRGDRERPVTVWDVTQGKPVFGPLRSWDSGTQRFGERALHHQLSQATLSPDGRTVVVGSDATGMLGLFDVDTGRERARVRGYRGLLSKIEFGAADGRFLTYGSDGVAQLWDAATLQTLGPPLRHPRFCRRADLGPDGWRVVTLDGEPAVRLWDGRNGDLLGRLRVSGMSNSLWLSKVGDRLVLNGGREVLDLPEFTGRLEDLPALLRLLTGLDQDADEGIGPVDAGTFINDPETYRRAWLGTR